MNKNTTLSLVLIVIAGLAILFYFNGGSNVNVNSSLSAENKVSQAPDAQYIYSLSQQMDQVQLDDSIFTNSFFQSLKDNTATFLPQPSGRDNPFAPIGG